MYVIQCVNLYIKPGGFTQDIQEAKRYKTIKEARKDCVYPWVVKPVGKVMQEEQAQ